MSTNCEFMSIIDIGPLVAKCDNPKMVQDPDVCEVVKQLDHACRETGFFYVKGHGIPESLLRDVRIITRTFFDLPYEEKIKIRMSNATGYLRGYQRTHENITSGVPDKLEAIDNIREVTQGMYGPLAKPIEGCNVWPSYPENFKTLMEEYISLCTEISRKIMRGIALALGGSIDEFEGKEIAGDPFWYFRLAGYPGISGENGKDMPENEIGCGAHTDYGLLALINQDDDITALQVKNKLGEWIPASPIPRTLVCNIGDMLQRMSNGIYESTTHRVINNSPKYRVCVGYFYETNFLAPVEPLDFCVKKIGGIKKFERAIYGEYLVGKIKYNFAM